MLLHMVDIADPGAVEALLKHTKHLMVKWIQIWGILRPQSVFRDKNFELTTSHDASMFANETLSIGNGHSRFGN